jgi:hypothetical protein
MVEARAGDLIPVSGPLQRLVELCFQPLDNGNRIGLGTVGSWIPCLLLVAPTAMQRVSHIGI